MSQLQVRGELDALCGGDVPISDEDHIGDRAPREHRTTYELTDKVDAAVLICHGHDDADRYEKYGADSQRKQQPIPR